MARHYSRRGTGSYRKRGKSHQVRRVVDGKAHCFSAATQADAQAKANAFVAEPRSSVRSPTVAEWLAEFIKRKIERRAPQTVRPYESHARVHIVPIIGKVRLDALTPEHIYKLHQASGGMALKVHMTLAMALNEARRYGHSVSKAVSIVDRPDRRPSTAVALNAEEARRLIEAARGDPLEALYVLAVTLGIRQGELLALRWQDLDIKSRQIHITGNLTRLQDGSRVITKPKTAASVRTLFLPQVCMDALARMARVNELVFPGPDGKPWVASSFYKRWEAMRKRSGIRAVRFHDLRHTADTLALDGGASVLAVMKTMGHTSRSMTLDRYGHLTDAAAEALADSIDARYGPRIRVLAGAGNGHEMDSENESLEISTDSECRERESNPHEVALGGF
jgi:integrase